MFLYCTSGPVLSLLAILGADYQHPGSPLIYIVATAFLYVAYYQYVRHRRRFRLTLAQSLVAIAGFHTVLSVLPYMFTSIMTNANPLQ